MGAAAQQLSCGRGCGIGVALVAMDQQERQAALVQQHHLARLLGAIRNPAVRQLGGDPSLDLGLVLAGDRRRPTGCRTNR